MNNDMLKTASEILKISIDEAQKHNKHLPDDDAYLFWKPVRGGGKLIIRNNGEKLTVGSLIDSETMLTMFRDGKRN